LPGTKLHGADFIIYKSVLDAQYPHGLLAGNPMSYALDHVCRGMVCKGQDRIAWLRTIRNVVEDFIKEPSESN
jgi:hypothetical protein